MPDGGSAFWTPAASRADAELPAVQKALAQTRAPPLRVSRVAQLDSELLDRELLAILQEPIVRSLADFRSPGQPSFEPELLALLRFVVLRLALHESGASYGAKLQNLKYRDERAYHGSHKSSPVVHSPSLVQLNTYAVLTVLPAYLHGRLRDAMLSNGWADYPVPRPTLQLFLPRLFGRKRADESPERDAARRRREMRRWVWELLSRAERLWQIASLANFLVFLYDGRYRTLVDRLLRMRLTYAQRSVTRNVSFEFLNRQLVWEAFTEFLLFLMPLINLRRLRVRLTRLLASSSAAQLLLASVPHTVRRALRLPDPHGTRPQPKGSGRTVGPLHHLPRDVCAICYSVAQAPPTSVPSSVDPTDPTASTTSLAALASQPATDREVKIPYEVSCCGAAYCYFCVVGRMVAWEEEHAGLASEGWPCLRCGGGVQSVQRAVGELVPDPLGAVEASEVESAGKENAA